MEGMVASVTSDTSSFIRGLLAYVFSCIRDAIILKKLELPMRRAGFFEKQLFWGRLCFVTLKSVIQK